jgi:flagellar M-ring protein FliF
MAEQTDITTTTGTTTVAETPPPPPPAGPKSGLTVLGESVKTWPLPRKLALGAIILLSLVLFATIIAQTRTADNQTLYANMNSGDAAAIISWLKDNNTPYQLTNNGRDIRVAAANVHELRLQLASEGLPKGGGVGFEIFDEQSFALTDFVQNVNYTRALQGELARTVSSLTPVESARVHLALPEKRLFRNQQKDATASVIVTLHPGQRLNEEQIQGIVHLVSGSIEGLRPENITVIDQNSRVLTTLADKGLIGAASPDMLEFQVQVENKLQERAQALLDRAVGSESSMVRVTAVLNFARFEKTEEVFDPEEPVIRSEQVDEEKSGTAGAGGVPGVESNLFDGGEAAGASPTSSRSSRTTNFEISKVVSKTINPVGTLQKLSVSVLVADRIIAATETEPEKAVPRSVEELANLQKMISSALGLNSARGDQIEVISMPFVESEKITIDAGGGENILYSYMPLIRYGLLLLAALMVYFLLVRPVIKTLRSDVTRHFKTAEELELERVKALNAGEQEKLELLMRDPGIKVRQAIEANPVFAAHIIKNWVHEPGGVRS